MNRTLGVCFSQAVNRGILVTALKACNAHALHARRRQMSQEPTGASPEPTEAGGSGTTTPFVIPVSASSAEGRAEVTIGSPTNRLRIGSDKCDWVMVAPSLSASGPVLTAATDVRVDVGAGRLRMDSDKCDFRFVVTDPAAGPVRAGTIRAGTEGSRVEVSTDIPGARGAVRYGPSDWTIEMAGAGSARGLSTQPQVRAEMRSDKCDFAVTVQVGLVGGRSVRLRAVGSDKCDFAIVEAPEVVDPPPGGIG
jgi:hypothetical protein